MVSNLSSWISRWSWKPFFFSFFFFYRKKKNNCKRTNRVWVKLKKNNMNIAKKLIWLHRHNHLLLFLRCSQKQNFSLKILKLQFLYYFETKLTLFPRAVTKLFSLLGKHVLAMFSAYTTVIKSAFFFFLKGILSCWESIGFEDAKVLEWK